MLCTIEGCVGGGTHQQAVLGHRDRGGAGAHLSLSALDSEKAESRGVDSSSVRARRVIDRLTLPPGRAVGADR
jgi:hypothetical protein